MYPLCLSSNNSPIRCRIVIRMIEILVAIGSAIELLVHWAAISDDDLRRVLIGHDDCGLWEAGSVWVGVVWLKGLLCHTCVQFTPLLVCPPSPWFYLWRALCVIIWIFSLPPCLLHWVSNGNCFSIAHHHVGAGPHSSRAEVWSWVFHLYPLESIWIMECSCSCLHLSRFGFHCF